MPAVVLEAKDVCRAFNGVPILFPTSIRLEGGQGLAVFGPNGSGKTTLLRLLAGLIRPSAGEVLINDVPPDGQIMRSTGLVGFVGHDSYLYDDLSGRENLRFFAAFATPRPSAMQIGEALERVGLAGAAQLRVRAYSAGMKRRLGLAKILLRNPKLLLLDEPHASLDADAAGLVDAVILDTIAAGGAVVIASHDLARVLTLCSRAMALNGGRVSFHGPTEALARNQLRIVRSS
jgi:heme exporter protein A